MFSVLRFECAAGEKIEDQVVGRADVLTQDSVSRRCYPVQFFVVACKFAIGEACALRVDHAVGIGLDDRYLAVHLIQHVATRTETPSLATESHQTLGVAVAAASPQEPMFQETTGQVVLNFTLHIGGQRPVARCQLRQERRVVCFNNLIQERLLGAVVGLALKQSSPDRPVPSKSIVAGTGTACGSCGAKR